MQLTTRKKKYDKYTDNPSCEGLSVYGDEYGGDAFDGNYSLPSGYLKPLPAPKGT